MLIDTHAHLNDERLAPLVDEIVNGMQADNLEKLITVGYDRLSSEQCLNYAIKYKDVYCAVGIHPHDSKDACIDDYEFFTKAVENKKCVAIGEIGLDYHYDLSPRDVQKQVCIEQIKLAHNLKKPIIFHLREAYRDMMDILEKNSEFLEYGFLLHCYSGSVEIAKEVLKMGAYLSFGGAVTFKNANKGEVVNCVPKARLLLETDCPYMTPVPYRGQANMPKYIYLIRDKIAELRGESKEDIEEYTTANAKRFFKIK